MLEGSSFSILVPSLLPRKQKIEGLSIDRENFTGELLYSQLGDQETHAVYLYSQCRVRRRISYGRIVVCVASFTVRRRFLLLV